MAQLEPDADLGTTAVVLLKDVPKLSKSTDYQRQQQAVRERVHCLLPRAQVQCVHNITSDPFAGAVVELSRDTKHGDKNVQKMYSLSTTTTFTISNPILEELFLNIISHYPQLKCGHKYEVSGSIESIIAFRDAINEEAAKLLLNESTSIAASSEHASPIKTSTQDEDAALDPLSPQSVYDNMSPDALALLEKLPIGTIEGVHYDSRAGQVLIDKDSKEDERISKFQEAYQSITSTRKLKVEAVTVPETLSPDALEDVVHRYNTTYNQCAFICQGENQDRIVKIVSTSSRQSDQAKTLLADDLSKIAPPKPICEVLTLSDGRKLTLKKADIVNEDVDMIVNPANSQLQHGGGVAKALDQASRGQLQNYSDRYLRGKSHVSVGKVAVTLGGGNLKCRHVCHAVGPDSTFGQADCKRLLSGVVINTLKCAERYDVNSISIPAISSGIFGVKTELVARCVTDAILTYNFTKPSPVLSDIRIVIIDQKTYAPFARYFQQKRLALDKKKSDHRSLIQPAKFKPPANSGATGPTSLPDLPMAEEGVPGSSSVDSTSPPDIKFGLKEDLAKLQTLLNGMARSWQHLGNLLGFSKDVLDKIASESDDPFVHLQKLLNKWLSGDGYSSTVSALMNALSRMPQTEDIVQSILTEYGGKASAVTVNPSSQSNTDSVTGIDGITYPNDLPPPLEPEPASTANNSSKDQSEATAVTSIAGKQPTEVSSSVAAVNNHPSPTGGNDSHHLNDPAKNYEKRSSWPNSTMYSQTSPYVTGTTFSGLTVASTVTSHPLQTTTVSTAPPGLGGQNPYPPPYPPPPGMGTNYVQVQPTGYPNAPRNYQGGNGVQYGSLSGYGAQPHHGQHPTTNYPGGGPRSYLQAAAGTGGVPAGYGYGNTATSQPQLQYQWTNQGAQSGHESRMSTGQGGESHHQKQHSDGDTKNGQTNSKDDECPICLETCVNPVKTKCGHVFCNDCINKALQHGSFCPTCKTALRAITGSQPVDGTMTWQFSRSKLPGYYDCGTIQIDYKIPGGVQTLEHPHPGQRFQGASRRAFLPYNHEGQEVLKLLKKAFDARLIFTVGMSVTSGQNNVVTWNDIHHKTNMHGGAQAYGYPDPTYLQRVKADLAAKGIVSDNLV